MAAEKMTVAKLLDTASAAEKIYKLDEYVLFSLLCALTTPQPPGLCRRRYHC